MAVSFVERVAAFFGDLWSFVLTLVRSLLALFSLRRRSSDPLSLPSVHQEALARAHTHLRPILLTPRSIERSPVYYRQRAQGTRTRSATSTVFPGHNETATVPTPGPQISDPQRTSPKPEPNDPELGLSVTTSIAADHTGPPSLTTTSFRGGTSDTSLLTPRSVLPLTPPDRCYLAPIPSATDCPYAEPWQINPAPDRGKHTLSGSPLKVSISANFVFAESIVRPIGSPPPGRWSPVQIWTSTPRKDDLPDLPDPALSSSDHHTQSTTDPSSVLASVSHALISRSRSSIRPYDEASNSSTTSDTGASVNYAPVAKAFQRPGPTHERYQARILKHQPALQFRRPDPYVGTWRRYGARLPGKPNRTTHAHAYARSRSHMDLSASEWHDADAHDSSLSSVLSPPQCESGTEDEDDMPLGRLRERLARRSAAAGASIGLGVPLDAGMCTHKAVVVSPRTRARTMSEGCLLAFSASTPTRVGVGARAGRQALSLAFEGDEHGAKDWLDALSLRFPSEQDDPATVPERGAPLPPSADVAAGLGST